MVIIGRLHVGLARVVTVLAKAPDPPIKVPPRSSSGTACLAV